LSFTAKTRRECQEWIRRSRDQIDDGLTFASTKLILGDYLMDWLATEKFIFRPSTWSHYQQLIRTYIVPNIGSITLKDLKTNDIQRMYTRLVKQRVGVPTIQKIQKLLHSSLGTAEETGIITRNPVSYAHPPREPYKEMKILDADQVSRFLFSIKGHIWEPLFHLAITSGMRLRELVALKWEDLDWIQQSLLIKRQLSKVPNSGDMFQPLKTNSSRRTITLGDETIQILRNHHDRQWSQRLRAGDRWVDNGLIFSNSKGRPICVSYLTERFKKLLDAAGIPRIRFHDIRHTNASLLISHGVPPTIVARRLGHSKISTTLDIYSHVSEGQQRDAARLLDELITPIELHTNYPRSPQSSENATQIDITVSDLAENLDNVPK
jgi:integrase